MFPIPYLPPPQIKTSSRETWNLKLSNPYISPLQKNYDRLPTSRQFLYYNSVLFKNTLFGLQITMKYCYE